MDYGFPSCMFTYCGEFSREKMLVLFSSSHLIKLGSDDDTTFLQVCKNC